MKRVFYSLAGEGLGHTGRVYAIAEQLNKTQDCEVHIFTFGEAYDYFKSLNYHYLHLIDGLRFGRFNKKVNNFLTIYNFLKYLSVCKKSYNYISGKIKELKPVLAITDFEPILPRVANKHGLQLLSIDNQHRFSRCSNHDLSFLLKTYCNIAGLFIEKYIPNPDYVIVSTFYNEFANDESLEVVGPIVREEFLKQEVKDDNFILLYYKKSVGEQILALLKKIKMPVVVYGHEKIGVEDNVTYKKLAYQEFAKDLASCKCVFGGAGNQLLCEALFLNKPVFAVPEPNQYEQYVNSEYLEMAGETYCHLKDLNFNKVLKFILHRKTKQYRYNLSNGTERACQIINSYINILK
jgi:uncharacterized protein (TIGR00661 family)